MIFDNAKEKKINHARKEVRSFFVSSLRLLFLMFAVSIPLFAQNKYDERRISDVDIVFEGADKDLSAAEQFRLIARTSLGDNYSAIRVREAIDAIYKSGKVVTIQVEATPVGNENVNLRFIIKRKTQVERVIFKISPSAQELITEDDLLLRLNLVNAGTMITKQTLRNNADLIQAYLREKGFYKATVDYSPENPENAPKATVVFQIDPKEQAQVEKFSVDIKGFDTTKISKSLKLQKGSSYSRDLLAKDVETIRKAILRESFLAPHLGEPKVIYDSDKNIIEIELKGDVGAKVAVNVEVDKEKVSEQTQERLLPIKREGTLDFSAIREGRNRLRNYYQEKGYFFVEIDELCSVIPEFPKDDANPTENKTTQLCEMLGGADIENREVEVKYSVNLNRRLKLKDIRIEGTDQITINDIISVLDTQRASLVGLIPRLGYGRGYTSTEILEDDRLRILSIMRDLGYRRATARVKQGVSPDGENLIITFVINEGIPTLIDGVEITGNKVFSNEALQKELPFLIGKNYSRARARNGAQKLAQLYAKEGYYDAKLNFSIIDLPKDDDSNEERVKIVYSIEKEGKKVIINRVLINGDDITDREAILKAIDLRQNEVLRATDIFSSEQNLYATDAFLRVEIKTEPAGETPAGESLRDVIITLEEQKPRVINYGGGYSTEFGVSGFFSIRHYNLFGNLQQGGARVSWSRRQQLVQFDFLNPRFIPDGKNRFAPLSLTLQYQRDSTVTRFFRSAFDQGTFGVVQRIDAQGNAINEFGNKVANPTINRLTFTAETSRTLSKAKRSLLFLRYRFEDVRLFNIDSLLISDLLRPDQRVRVSGFGATVVRDTRENCSRKFSLLELISKGEAGNPCRYNPSDPTGGSFLTMEYNVSARPIGANISFQKFSANYQTYYQIPQLNNAVLAARVILGLGDVISKSNRFTGNLETFNNYLPISERYFAGGSTTLRGFDFESAGPRVIVNPQGIFRNNQGEIVTLNPFTVPLGGNGLAITNLEARVPLSETVQAVPFYDGGNVFNRVGDIFKPLKTETGDIMKDNLRATWTHTVGLGLRIKTPFGGSVAIDYGILLNPPKFIVPQTSGNNAIFQPRQTQLHFRFAQTF